MKRRTWKPADTDYGAHSYPQPSATRADILRRIGERPTEDNRSLTARLFGDPPHGRSALDRERRVSA